MLGFICGFGGGFKTDQEMVSRHLSWFVVSEFLKKNWRLDSLDLLVVAGIVCWDSLI